MLDVPWGPRNVGDEFNIRKRGSLESWACSARPRGFVKVSPKMVFLALKSPIITARGKLEICCRSSLGSSSLGWI